MDHFIVAAIQMVSRQNMENNLQEAERLVGQAAEQGAMLAVLPECFALLDMDNTLPSGKSELARQACSRMAAKYRIHLVAGTLAVYDNPEDRRPYATCFLYDDHGREVARYNKIHLFDASVNDAQKGYRESASYSSGNLVTIANTPFGRIGFAVCYDLRFPELFRLLSDQKADIIVLPSAFTKVTGMAHWMPLLQARAIENQCFIIAANQGGKHSSIRETYGHSAIISPWGEVMASMEQGVGIITAKLEKKMLETVRKRMPVKAHQRFSVCEKIDKK